MIEYVLIGKLVNTHALKGEVRIISDFEFKDKVFKLNNKLYIGTFKKEVTINSYRIHKTYDMVTFIGMDSINDVISFKGSNVYVDKKSLELNEEEILTEDLINMEVIFENNCVGLIEDYRSDNGNKMIQVNGKYLPYNKDFIESIDIKNKKIYYKNIGELL